MKGGGGGGEGRTGKGTKQYFSTILELTSRISSNFGECELLRSQAAAGYAPSPHRDPTRPSPPARLHPLDQHHFGFLVLPDLSIIYLATCAFLLHCFEAEFGSLLRVVFPRLLCCFLGRARDRISQFVGLARCFVLGFLDLWFCFFLGLRFWVEWTSFEVAAVLLVVRGSFSSRRCWFFCGRVLWV